MSEYTTPHDTTSITFQPDRGSVYLTFKWRGGKYKIPNVGWGLDEVGYQHRMVPLFHHEGRLYTASEFPCRRCPSEGWTASRRVISANFIDELGSGNGNFAGYRTELQLCEDITAYLATHTKSKPDVKPVAPF